MRDPGTPDAVDLNALQHQVQHLPADTLLFLLGSRYCETDRLSEEAWRLFGHAPVGWSRVQAICNFVHNHLIFGYEHSRATRIGFGAYVERRGVCRDYAHLAIAFCRCLNIPARYCTGYITDVGLPPPTRPWILRPGSKPISAAGGTPLTRVTTLLGSAFMAHGRDAADVPLTHAFGLGTFSGFRVWADEAVE